MPVTSNDIGNQALQLTGDNAPTVTGQSPTWDQSPAGIALQKLYSPTVATMARHWGWDLARNTVVLTPTANTPLDPSWSIEYLYPANGVQVWQLTNPANADPNNPLPINWSVGNTLVTGVQTKVIWTNLAGAICNYNNNPTENVWDPLFREAVVRLLASVLSMALEGRPDSAEAYLNSGAAFETIGEGRPD